MTRQLRLFLAMVIFAIAFVASATPTQAQNPAEGRYTFSISAQSLNSDYQHNIRNFFAWVTPSAQSSNDFAGSVQIEAGQAFSINDYFGPYTTEQGMKVVVNQGDGSCNTASMLNYVASMAGLTVEADQPTHPPVAGVPEQYWTTVWSGTGEAEKDLVISNPFSNPVSIHWEVKGDEVTLWVEGTPAQAENLTPDSFFAGRLVSSDGQWLSPVSGDLLGSNEQDHLERGSVNAWDITVPYGTSIYPMSAGTVTHADCDNSGNYGCWVEVQHEGGYMSQYAHMDIGTIAVRVGESVNQWTKLGEVGSTGRTSWNHVHWVVKKDSEHLELSQFFNRTQMRRCFWSSTRADGTSCKNLDERANQLLLAESSRSSWPSWQLTPEIRKAVQAAINWLQSNADWGVVLFAGTTVVFCILWLITLHMLIKERRKQQARTYLYWYTDRIAKAMQWRVWLATLLGGWGIVSGDVYLRWLALPIAVMSWAYFYARAHHIQRVAEGRRPFWPRFVGQVLFWLMNFATHAWLVVSLIAALTIYEPPNLFGLVQDPWVVQRLELPQEIRAMETEEGEFLLSDVTYEAGFPQFSVRYWNGQPASFSVPTEVAEAVATATIKNKCDPWLLIAVAHSESSVYQNTKPSMVGADGVWQFMPTTWAEMWPGEMNPPSRRDIPAAADAACRFINYLELGQQTSQDDFVARFTGEDGGRVWNEHQGQAEYVWNLWQTLRNLPTAP